MAPAAPTHRAPLSALDLGAVALGGALGTLLRAGGLAVGSWAGAGMEGGEGGVAGALLSPSGITLLENLVGAGLLGLLLGLLMANGRLEEIIPRRLRLLLTTGLLGSFTTFSALALDGALLLGMDARIPGAEAAMEGAGTGLGGWPSGLWSGISLLILSVVGGLTLAFAGLLAGRRVGGERGPLGGGSARGPGGGPGPATPRSGGGGPRPEGRPRPGGGPRPGHPGEDG